MIRKFYCFFMALSVALSCSIAAAAQIGYNEDTGEYCIMLGESDERINNEGEFTFKIRTAIESNPFTFNSTKADIEASADTVDTAGNIYPDVEFDYNVELRTSTLGIGHAVCSTYGTTGSSVASMSTNKIEIGKKYTVYISVDAQTTGSYWVSGEGFVTNVDEVF